MKVLYVVGNDDMPLYSMEVNDAVQPCGGGSGGSREGSVSYYLQAELEQLSTMHGQTATRLEIRAVR